MENLVIDMSVPKIALIGLGSFGKQYANILFDLEEDGKILMDASGDDLKITLNPPNDEAETTLILSKENMEELITGELSPMVAFTMGKVKVLGSKGVALKLSGLLEN